MKIVKIHFYYIVINFLECGSGVISEGGEAKQLSQMISEDFGNFKFCKSASIFSKFSSLESLHFHCFMRILLMDVNPSITKGSIRLLLKEKKSSLIFQFNLMKYEKYLTKYWKLKTQFYSHAPRVTFNKFHLIFENDCVLDYKIQNS